MSVRVLTSISWVVAISCSLAVWAQSTPDAAAIIAKRQDGLEQIGDAFKTIRDQIRGDRDTAAITAAAEKINTLGGEVHMWFPAGTGPETGIETEALPAIWEKNADFHAAAEGLSKAAGEMLAAAKSGDMAAVGANVRTLGGACKNCHDNFRLDND